MWILIDRSSLESYRESLSILTDFICNECESCSVLNVVVPELHDTEPTLDTLDVLFNVLLPIALHRPTLHVVPIFEFLYKEKDIKHRDPQAEVVCGNLANVSGWLERVMRPYISLRRAQSASSIDPISSCRIILPRSAEQSVRKDLLRFKTVAVGGTFDRFHAGHRLLLGATAMVATSTVFIGITSDKLLQNKKAKELLQSYEERCECAVSYIQTVNPTLELVSAGSLTDPQIPPLCATEEDFDAIVVSEETIGGAYEINRVREELGFHPLVIVVVGLLSAAGHDKLSSSTLRVQEEDVSK